MSKEEHQRVIVDAIKRWEIKYEKQVPVYPTGKTGESIAKKNARQGRPRRLPPMTDAQRKVYQKLKSCGIATDEAIKEALK